MAGQPRQGSQSSLGEVARMAYVNPLFAHRLMSAFTVGARGLSHDVARPVSFALIGSFRPQGIQATAGIAFQA